MPTTKTLKAAMHRKSRRLYRLKLKAKHSKEVKDRVKALDEVHELKLEIARLQQQITMNEIKGV